MNILFVCTGNTCRSPMAEYYLSSLHIPDIKVTSAGIYAMGEKISPQSVEVMSEIGISACDHIPRPLTDELINGADLIYCMTASHKALLVSLGVNEGKILLLKDSGISDPFGGDTEIYRKCRNEITDSIDKLFGYHQKQVSYLTEADAKGINSLEKLCFSQPWSENSIIESMKGSNTFIGIKDGSDIIGYLSFYESLGEGYINNVAVHPEYRRKGIARALLCELIHYAISSSLSFLTLEVRQSNTAAINLYTAFGFKQEGRRKNYYTAPNEDAIILTRRF